jgi:hypothetical protein
MLRELSLTAESLRSVDQQSSLNVNPVESKVLNPLVDSFRGHHLAHASLANSVSVKNFEELLELNFLGMISFLHENHLVGASFLCKVD